MKYKFILIACYFLIGIPDTNAQDTWTQKASFGGGGRKSSVGFNIGNKGYIGTGDISYANIYYSDLWEYDPGTNVWTQKADFPGGSRTSAMGFSIGAKGYLGTGGYFDENDRSWHVYNDFWEYDPSSNAWTKKADFTGGARIASVGFSIGDKGFIGTGRGQDGSTSYKDFWEYDPSANTWTKKSDFGGNERSGAVGFCIGNKGYLGTGNAQDFWEYDPIINTWAQKADFGGGVRNSASGFSVGTKGYIGLGGQVTDFWEYTPSTNTWLQKADLPDKMRGGAPAFSIGAKGYLGTGFNTTPLNPGFLSDFWEYSVSSIATGTLAGNSYCMPAQGIAVNVPFTITGSFSTGNVFTAQLSDSLGSFANPVNIGSLAGTATGNIPAIIPNSVLGGYHYRIRVIANNLFCTGTDNGADIFIDNFSYYKDADGDGYGDINNRINNICPVPAGYIRDSADCNDNPATGGAAVHPGATEVCNGIDEDCDGLIDEGVQLTFYQDGDGDGYGNAAVTTQACTAPAGYTANNRDCNDDDATVHIPILYYPDGDGDGYGYNFNNDTDVNSCWFWYNSFNTIYADFVGDRNCGFDQPPTPAFFCSSAPPTGWAANGNDCNDNSTAINPATIWILDNDQDDYYSGSTVIRCTSPGSEYIIKSTQQTGDCNDNDAAIHPGATEVCDGIDNDCDGSVDEGVKITYYRDADNDGYGNANLSIQACSTPAGYVSDNTDCSDNDPTVNPGAVEVCGNKKDDNCNGAVDEKGCYNCQNATSFSTTNITSNSATFNWVSVPNPADWQLQYKSTSPGTKWANVTPAIAGNKRSITINGLAANKNYLWHIKAKCGKAYTDYSVSIPFNTTVVGVIANKTGSTEKEVMEIAGIETLQVKAMPNPSNSNFRLMVTAPDLSEKITINITDIIGRRIESRIAISGQTISIGEAYKPGIYIVQVIQGTNHKEIKLVKLSD